LYIPIPDSIRPIKVKEENSQVTGNTESMTVKYEEKEEREDVNVAERETSEKANIGERTALRTVYIMLSKSVNIIIQNVEIS